VTHWLETYKFKFWKTHSSNGKPVTKEERHKRAEEIASDLRSQSKWKTHGRSIKLKDLENLKVRITDFSKDLDLNNAITRYYALMRMTFDNTSIYKMYETPENWIFRNKGKAVEKPSSLDKAIADLNCPKCKHPFKLQVNFKKGEPIQPNSTPYPLEDDVLKCPSCHFENNIAELRKGWEKQVGKKVV